MLRSKRNLLLGLHRELYVFTHVQIATKKQVFASHIRCGDGDGETKVRGLDGEFVVVASKIRQHEGAIIFLHDVELDAASSNITVVVKFAAVQLPMAS